jgi:hypothetical protein
MLLSEMFSAIGAPKEQEQDIDWLDDLKFFIDNNNNLLTKQMFPAVEKHKKYKDHPKAYTIYVKPLEACMEEYCKIFQIEDRSDKFPKEKMIELAKHISEEQRKHIEHGDYEK